MITFTFTIQEDADGRVSMQCLTPPSKATVREQEVARAIQKTLLSVKSDKFKAFVTMPWTGANNPKRN